MSCDSDDCAEECGLPDYGLMCSVCKKVKQDPAPVREKPQCGKCSPRDVDNRPEHPEVTVFRKMMERRGHYFPPGQCKMSVRYLENGDFTVALVSIDGHEDVGVSKRMSTDKHDANKGRRLALSRAADKLAYFLDPPVDVPF